MGGTGAASNAFDRMCGCTSETQHIIRNMQGYVGLLSRRFSNRVSGSELR